ncbi:dienelactone hydrolase family protein [Anabaena cylindrica FACHB-243]|uniref:Dienelactone hydrolase n=1 Tax=Anabaena cylindrica (strain ATCC 27899 / PCC 7122) TaxID=272123 RepID=K9ZF34_ANACC|nr:MULTISPECIES: dienelactone hydrolase family protein [Anabaena]AFZ56980.1 dienelactone hydrolase [Anabaena cylindrica PCC 7122]MBD2418890.1 dienelactone hydrolase family protein [Anabaena cylindrica FACHB-243]MBY5285495.1 dienelactone hydrolase family protein [Anabaena sp. CCAP 1446/1C]MBY5311806.1 dienelactone hydrolase family protein [Anabaena sp. CCAP 1446/1C]MCM2405170.1 dienelactone hydrolase family protein [Anabaena sp. CCAP 1446/1C]
MQIVKRNIELRVDDSLMRVYLASPKPEGKYPGIVFYSDIYQLGDAIIRLVNYLAGFGYIVAAPEIFHRIEPVGSIIEPNDIGRMRGNDDARRTLISEYDADTRAVIDFLKNDNSVIADKIGTLGFCIGGHLAFRAAFASEIKACVSCYPTGVPSGKLGQGVADTIDRFEEIKGEMLLVFGTQDPHIPENDRQTIVNALETAKIPHQLFSYEAEHTFMRDDGYRYDAVASTAAWGEIIAFLERKFKN